MDLKASVAHPNYLLPHGVTGSWDYTLENFDRLGHALVDLAALTSGTLRLIAVPLPTGFTASRVAFLSGASALSGGRNQWAALLSSSYRRFAVSADKGSAAWQANSLQVFTFATPWTVINAGVYYIGLLINAAKPPSLQGLADFNSAAALLSPPIGGDSSGGLTGPTSLPAAPAAPSGANAGMKPYVLLG